MNLEEERLLTREGVGKDLFKIRLTSVREKLSVDLFECFFIDHTTGALLCERKRVSGKDGGPTPEGGDWVQPWVLGFPSSLMNRNWVTTCTPRCLQVSSRDSHPALGLKLLCKMMRQPQRVGTVRWKELGLWA